MKMNMKENWEAFVQVYQWSIAKGFRVSIRASEQAMERQRVN